MSVNSNSGNYTRLRNKSPKIVTISARKERNLSIKKVTLILQKDESKRTKEEKELLYNYSELVREAKLRIEKRKKLKERLKEVEDAESILDDKCKQLAEAILKSQYLVVYTGAGISTAARIPDYRGASGIWTLLQQGKDIGTHDLTQADPTYTHMALFELYSQGKLKHIVSQNCDGLHLRSGLPKKALSEVHGNMYIEVCRSCRPIIEYLRIFDVTENTARYSHRTMRKCYKCNSSLVDSIVHFGERGNLPWPLNWKGACKAAEKADMILCMGSSLKVLKRYPWLWCMDKPAKRRPGIYIVNLQWTPKDCQAIIKINGKCDRVMEKLMRYLSITVPTYSRHSDPIFVHATSLCKEEHHTTNRPNLTRTKLEPEAKVKAEPETKVKREPESGEDLEPGECKLSTEAAGEDVGHGGTPIKKEPVDEAEVEDRRSESCVTSCKKEIIIDTGQGRDVKFIKKELIVITIKSGDSFKDCCSLFGTNQSHECDCPNFIDEQNDIPVIIEDDLVVLKKNNNVTSSLNLDNILNLDKSSDTNSASANKNGSVKFAQNTFTKENDLNNKSHMKRTSDSDGETGRLKKSKFDHCPMGLGKKAGGDSPTGGLDPDTPIKSEKFNCQFCWDRYLSNSCLFYLKREAFFKGNVPVCDCCDDDDDDDQDEDGVENGNNDAGSEPFEEKPTEMTKVAVNPGWYGKGLRKNYRKKR